MCSLVRGKGSLPSHLLGAYRLPWLGTWGNEEMQKTLHIFPHSFWALADPFPILEARTRGLPGTLTDYTNAHARLPMTLHLAWKCQRKNIGNSLLAWRYLKFRSSFPILLLSLFTSQNLQIAAPCILFRFHNCIPYKRQNGMFFHLPIIRNPWKIFTKFPLA